MYDPSDSAASYHSVRSWLPFPQSLFPESSSQMAADPLISGLRLPDGALMSRHSLRMQPCRDQAKLLCVYVFCFFLLFVGAALQALHCDDT